MWAETTISVSPRHYLPRPHNVIVYPLLSTSFVRMPRVPADEKTAVRVVAKVPMDSHPCAVPSPTPSPPFDWGRSDIATY